MKKLLIALLLFPATLLSQEEDSLFSDVWVRAGKTSAVVFWQLGDISKEAKSYVEYGETESYGDSTKLTDDARRAQFHQITGLTLESEYHFRIVVLIDGKETKSQDYTFATEAYGDAIEIAADDGSKIVLDQANSTYILAEDVNADATAIEIAAKGITLDLDGHTVRYSNNSDADYLYGIEITKPDAKIYNGKVIQGEVGGDYSYAVGSRWKADGVEVAGLFTDVNRPNAYPLSLGGRAKNDINIHHNHFYSTVTTIESRHYPGNDLLRIDADEETAEVRVHHNLLTEGCHCGISFRAAAKSLEIYENDIEHHQRFVNGYALYGSGLKGGKIHRNRINSIGRTIHLTAPDIEYYNNWASTKGHMTLSDMPQGSGNWLERRVELHGIKFEGNNAKNIKVHDNYMKITQPQPDENWDYVPATPLNIASYNPDAMNEIYNNTIIAHTSYKTTHHGGYGESGQWASSIYFVGMDGESSPDMYSAYVHDNYFESNDLFISGDISENHLVRIEDNVFKLGSEPTESWAIFRSIPEAMRNRVMNGNNEFILDTASDVDISSYAKGSANLRAYPNPASERLTINYRVLKATNIEIAIYNSLGEKIDVILSSENVGAGEATTVYDARQLSAGMYYITMEVGTRIETARLFVLKR